MPIHRGSDKKVVSINGGTRKSIITFVVTKNNARVQRVATSIKKVDIS
jgi:hypothetical protein